MVEGRDGHLKGGKVGRWIDEKDEKVEPGKHLKVRRIGHLKGGLGRRKGGLEKRKIYRRKIFWPWPSTFQLKELFFSAFSNRASTLLLKELIYNKKCRNNNNKIILINYF